MPDIEMPDADELGGNVTKPFKFVTGMAFRNPTKFEMGMALTVEL